MGVRRRPAFLDGSRGPLFVVSFEADDAPPRQTLVLIAPFGEEMNRSRRMLALQAEALAAIGWRAVVFDFFGTGDSAGLLSSATLQDWLDDLDRVLESVRTDVNFHPWLLGVRFGALVAAVAASRPEVGGLVLWQPATSGRQVMSQFFRLQAAGALLAGKQSASAGGRERLDRGETIEIAGYPLSAPLVRSIESLELEAALAGVRCPTAWFEVVSRPDQSLGAAARKWQGQTGAERSATMVGTVVGDPFWTTVETAIVPDLVTQTTAFAVRESAHAT